MAAGTKNRKINKLNKTKSHKDVEGYISSLLDGRTDRKSEAKDALIRSGVLGKNGAAKKVIVSWE